MTKSLNDDSTARFHAILEGDRNGEEIPISSPPLQPPRDALDFLPRASNDESAASAPPPEPSRDILDRLPRASKGASAAPGPRRHANPPPETGPAPKSRRERYRHAFWHVTSWLALLVDSILIAVVIILLLYVRRLNVQVSELMKLTDMPVTTMSRLYNSFEDMNNAHIVTTIPFDTEIPVQFDLQINQQTEVVLSQDIRINGAHVTMSTGGLEISSAANIILPAGTRLPIMLALTVLVDKKVPVSLQVPVDIVLSQTDLGAAFTGLMDALEPLYCMLEPLATDKAHVLICEKAKTP